MRTREVIRIIPRTISKIIGATNRLEAAGTARYEEELRKRLDAERSRREAEVQKWERIRGLDRTLRSIVTDTALLEDISRYGDNSNTMGEKELRVSSTLSIATDGAVQIHTRERGAEAVVRAQLLPIDRQSSIAPLGNGRGVPVRPDILAANVDFVDPEDQTAFVITDANGLPRLQAGALLSEFYGKLFEEESITPDLLLSKVAAAREAMLANQGKSTRIP